MIVAPTQSPDIPSEFAILPTYEPGIGTRAYCVLWLARSLAGLRRTAHQADRARREIGDWSDTFHRIAEDAERWAETANDWERELAKHERRPASSAPVHRYEWRKAVSSD